MPRYLWTGCSMCNLGCMLCLLLPACVTKTGGCDSDAILCNPDWGLSSLLPACVTQTVAVFTAASLCNPDWEFSLLPAWGCIHCLQKSDWGIVTSDSQRNLGRGVMLTVSSLCDQGNGVVSSLRNSGWET